MGEPSYKKIVHAWCLYDWANSAFATTIMAALFPPFYRSLAIHAGLAPNSATAYWGYTTALALLLAALAAPVLGAISDYTGGKKRYIGFFAGLGILATLSMAFLREGRWITASIVFLAGDIGFAGANTFYESLLPHIARDEDMDRISGRGYALGYLGGGILLVLNALWVMRPGWFGMPDANFALRCSFVSVAVWWGCFSAPLFKTVPDPPSCRGAAPPINPIRAGFKRLAATCGEISRYRQAFTFLVAFWIYNDGIGTIIKMATAYGDEIGIGIGHMTAALVITQFVGFPATMIFSSLAGKIGGKRMVLLGLAVYAAISCGAYFMSSPLHFFILAFLVGLVQGGTQALSRSLFGAMVPKHRSAEFFGFFSTAAKFAGIAGPLLFGVVGQLTGKSRLGIFSLVVFFVAGALVLLMVDVDEGRRQARAAEADAA